VQWLTGKISARGLGVRSNRAHKFWAFEAAKPRDCHCYEIPKLRDMTHTKVLVLRKERGSASSRLHEPGIPVFISSYNQIFVQISTQASTSKIPDQGNHPDWCNG
jgi:hypothetical protein